MPTTRNVIEIIDDSILDQQYQKVLSYVNNITTAIKAVPRIYEDTKNADTFAAKKKANDELNKGNQAVKQGVNEVSLALKEYEKLFNTLTQTQAKTSVSTSNVAKELVAAKIAQGDLNKELKNTAIATGAAQGSLVQLEAQLNSSRLAYSKLSEAERNSSSGQELLQKIKGQAQAFDELKSSMGQFQQRVGNYSGALNILKESVDQIKNKLNQLTAAGQTNSEEFEALQREYSLLDTLLARQAEGFTTLSREVMMTGKQLETLAAQGMQNTEVFQRLEQSYVSAKSELMEFQKNQQLLANPNKNLAALTLTAKALGGTYATAAGAAALFADGNEKVEKELNKLVAIMTILQGLNELHEFMEKRGAVLTIARTAAEKLKNFVMTGSTQGIVQNTAAQEANTIATTTGTVATKTMTSAMVGLRFALITTGIGALLILLPSIASAMGNASNSASTMNNKMKETAMNLEVLRASMEHAKDAFVEAKKQLEEVRTALDYAKEGIISKQKAVDIYNESIGKTMGQVKTFTEVEDKLADPERTKAYVDMMLYRAAANYALEEASKKAYEAEINHQKSLEKVADVKRKGESEKDKAAGADGLSEFLSSGLKNEAEKTKEEADKSVNAIENVATMFQNKVKEIAKKFKFDPTGSGDDDKNKGKPKNTLSDQFKLDDEARKASFQTHIQLMQDEMSASQRVADNDKNNFVIRMAAAQHYFDLKKQISEEQKNFDLADINKKEAEDIKVAETEKKGQAVINAIRKNAAAQRGLIEAKSNSELLTINAERYSKERQLFDKHMDEMKKKEEQKAKELEQHRQSIHETDLQNISNEYEQELLQLDQSYAKKKTHTDKEEREYANQKLIVQEKYQIKALEADILFTKETLDLAEARAKTSGKQEDIDAVAKAKSQLASLEIKLATTVTQFKIDQNKKIDSSDDAAFKKKIDRLTKYASYAKQVEEIIGGFVQNSIDKQKNALQDKQNIIDKNYEQEVNNITNSTLAEQDKANKLKILEAQKLAQTEQIERRKRQLEVEKARFEKAQNIASIIMETSLAVVRALGDKTIPGPARIAEAAIIGVLGAAQLVRAATAPIPKYFKGRSENDPYEGPAIVGDGGKRELIIRKDGKMEVTPDKPAITHVRKGDVIHPDILNIPGFQQLNSFDGVNQRLNERMIQKTAIILQQVAQKEDHTAKEIRHMKEALSFELQRNTKAVKDQKKKTVVNNHIDLGWTEYVKRKVFD
jgi:hypothetical protein